MEIDLSRLVSSLHCLDSTLNGEAVNEIRYENTQEQYINIHRRILIERITVLPASNRYFLDAKIFDESTQSKNRLPFLLALSARPDVFEA